MPRLLLFDIDGTLVDTRGAGGSALMDAVEDVFGIPRARIPKLELGGATDGGITRDLMGHVGSAFDASRIADYHVSYLGHLRRRLHADDFPGVLLPGVAELLPALAQRADVHLGLLTGNLRRGAEHKLRRFGVWDFFADGGFGDDAEDRNLLGAFAKARMEQARGVTYRADDVFVIGDTPKDIACADAIGARCIAVTTGSFTRAELEVHSPFAVLDSLEGDALLRAVARADGTAA